MMNSRYIYDRQIDRQTNRQTGTQTNKDYSSWEETELVFRQISEKVESVGRKVMSLTDSSNWFAHFRKPITVSTKFAGPPFTWF